MGKEAQVAGTGLVWERQNERERLIIRSIQPMVGVIKGRPPPPLGKGRRLPQGRTSLARLRAIRAMASRLIARSRR